jgi:hypothetical protein
VSDLSIFPLFLVTAIFLFVVVWHVRSSRSRRTSPVRLKVRISYKGGTKHVDVNGVEITDPGSIADPALRQAVARGEQVLQQALGYVELGGLPPTGAHRGVMIDEVMYRDVSEIPDARQRKLAEAALKQRKHLEL